MAAYLMLIIGLGLTTTAVQADDVQLAWGFNIIDAQLNASSNDTLIFNYEPIHTVFSVPSLVALEACDFSEGKELCSFADSPCSVPLSQFNDSSKVWIACSVHCESNDMRLTISLSNGTKEYEYEDDGPYLGR